MEAVEQTEDTVSLDKSRSFAIVTPPENGAHYLQDNFYFSAHGELVTHPALFTDKDQKRLAGMMARKRADRAAAKAFEAELAKSGMGEDEIAKTVEAAKAGDVKIATSDSDVDIRGWATGRVKYPWFQVRAAIVAQHSISVDDKETALNRLVDIGFIREDEIAIR